MEQVKTDRAFLLDAIIEAAETISASAKELGKEVTISCGMLGEKWNMEVNISE